MRYRRILLKISGEALMGEQSFGIDPAMIGYVAAEIQDVLQEGVQLGLVIGAGNIFRGMAGAAAGMDRGTADNMGMLATVLNSLAVQDGLSRLGIVARVMSAISMRNVCDPFVRSHALAALDRGEVVIFAGGTGNPYFTTDTAGVLRALEIKADVMMKATRVDGVYDRDPEKDVNAVRYERLDYDRVLRERLRVMDAAGISLARDNNLAILVFNMKTPGNIVRAARGEDVGTIVARHDT